MLRDNNELGRIMLSSINRGGELGLGLFFRHNDMMEGEDIGGGV